MVNHGCHPTGLGPQAVISSDYPGVMRKALTDRGVADVVMFLQGAAGNLKQGHKSVIRLDGLVVPRTSMFWAVFWPMRWLQRSIKPPRLMDPLSTLLSQLSCPQGLPTLEYLRGRKCLCAASDSGRLGQCRQDRYPEGAKGFEIEVGAVALGPVVFVAIPGEP